MFRRMTSNLLGLATSVRKKNNKKENFKISYESNPSKIVEFILLERWNCLCHSSCAYGNTYDIVIIIPNWQYSGLQNVDIIDWCLTGLPLNDFFKFMFVFFKILIQFIKKLNFFFLKININTLSAARGKGVWFKHFLVR